MGAGKIGRGFLAHLAAGWAVTFVDRSAGLVEELLRLIREALPPA